MTWAIAYVYMRYAGRFDRITTSILADAEDAAASGSADGGR